MLGIAGMLDKAKKGGTHIYDRTTSFWRCKKVEFGFEERVGKRPDKETGYGEQWIAIDGELLPYKKKIVMECIKDNVEFVC